MKLHLLALFVITSSFATASTAQGLSNEGSFSYRFSVYCLKPLDREGLYFRDASGQYTELKLKLKSRSEEYEAKILYESPSLKFYRKQETVKGDESMLLVAEQQIQSGTGRFLLAFCRMRPTGIKQEGGFPEFHVVEMNDSKSVFPNGSIRLLNTTGVNVIGNINGNRFDLGPDESSQPFSGLSSAKAQVSIAARGKQKYHLLYKNLIPTSEDRRSLLIISPPARAGSLKVGGRLLIDD
jgi:hypothetical protein